VDNELYIIDGGSKDKTLAIVKKWQETNCNIHLLTNPQKYVPFALNIGIKASNGDPIIRLDAHTEYDNNYVGQIVETFRKNDADIVGGPMNPVGKLSLQKAIAFATMNKFGIGGSKIHNINYAGYSDHVYLGAWKRELFNEIGYFDTRLKRNQDDEFHYRAKSKGKKIYLSPQIKSFYYPRNKISHLIKQYFQYGLFKPIVLRKVYSETKLRHLIPSLFCLYLLLLLIHLSDNILIYIPLILYVIANINFSFSNNQKLVNKFLLLFIYPVIHLSYGFGFIFGLGIINKKEKT
jgi:succinoglycan biosynthesis protein ExoA